ncbi:MAG: YeeE/YedE family protein [Gammaproteobacteria bacterium]|nr:YeeE/YedE family protein [Gammaproteobacteria bacterium]NND38973.1 YeeE/YedE family protein [Pseudomonadales bacterium]NNL11579.1 YeeE/YedE family protein [Pseudomonadales bacterium]NNM10963.1 YeeE/YedE family protein [Pseudomonadales bacterium]RZV60122.1 MAG: YeeE/YedE family protein [Pseudomonadales bacterium]
MTFSIYSALAGGALIGLAAVAMMATIGRIAGVSGILANVLKPASALHWQWAFVGGLLASGLFIHWLVQPVVIQVQSSSVMLVVAGLLVGFGTRLGSGCTSGHGVCGISRLSPRSLLATGVFISFGVLTVFVLRFF